MHDSLLCLRSFSAGGGLVESQLGGEEGGRGLGRRWLSVGNGMIEARTVSYQSEYSYSVVWQCQYRALPSPTEQSIQTNTTSHLSALTTDFLLHHSLTGQLTRSVLESVARARPAERRMHWERMIRLMTRCGGADWCADCLGTHY